jgi:PTH1 family peptidyl-tRNA hydrolase
MKMIVGLGNPGRDYVKTRHNIGWMVLDALQTDLTVTQRKERFRAVIVEGTRNGGRLVLVAPQTYMNLSGHAVREARAWYKIATEAILIVMDDMDLPFGTLRLRGQGSAGGHNGLRSVIEQLGTTEVARLKIGIGRPKGAAVGHVLSRFSPDEERQLPDVIFRAVGAVRRWGDDGLLAAMNEVNGREAPAADGPIPAEEQGA